MATGQRICSKDSSLVSVRTSRIKVESSNLTRVNILEMLSQIAVFDHSSSIEKPSDLISNKVKLIPELGFPLHYQGTVGQKNGMRTTICFGSRILL